MENLIRTYDKAATWLMKDALKNRDYLPWQGHTQFVVMMTTGLLMWGYAFLAYFTFSDPTAGRVGFAMSLAHFLSPLLLRYGKSINLAAHILIGAGCIHQGTFAYYSGGFSSNILIWYGILPMLGGIILGKRGILLWTTITTSIAGFFLYKQVYLTPFPNTISETGWLIAQAMMVFGWIFLSTTTIFVFNLLMERHNEEIEYNAGKIRTLVRVLCHDLNNPLTAIKTKVALTKKKIDDPALKEKLDSINLPINMINEIIKQVRKWEAVESGKLTVGLEPIKINDVIEETLTLFEIPLYNKGLTLELDIPDSELFVMAERNTLQTQVLANILSNAIKFSNQGGTIRLKVDYDDGLVKICILDEGIGIPRNILIHLFDPSKKTSRSGTAEEKGTGFGMPIVKTYIEKFGGHILVKSKIKDSEELQEDGLSTESSEAGLQLLQKVITGTLFEIVLKRAQKSKAETTELG